MSHFLYLKKWSWLASGIALAIAFLLAVALVKPIGVSTQFVILDGIIWDGIFDEVIVEDSTAKSGYTSTNAYLNKSGGKYAKHASNPLNYSFVFVISMVLGGFIASKMQSSNAKIDDPISPPIWKERFGDAAPSRLFTAFVCGALVLFGARLAGGCTSGHMMSGMMQTSISGYLFALGAFAVAIPVSILIYKRG